MPPLGSATSQARSSYQYSSPKDSTPQSNKSAQEQIDEIKKNAQKAMGVKINGKDTSEMIQEQENIQQIKVLQAKIKVEEIVNDLESLGTITAHSKVLMNSASAFNGVDVSNMLKGGVFADPYATVSSGPQDAMTIIVSPTTKADSIAINILQMATKDNVAASAAIVDQTTPLGWNGTLVINGASLAITPDMNLQKVQAVVNRSSTAGVTANISLADNGCYLSFAAHTLAQPITIDSSAMSGTGLLGGQIPASSIKQVADLSAKVEFRNTGQFKTYATNTITDQVKGVTFNLNPLCSVTTFPISTVVTIQMNQSAPTDLLLGDGKDYGNEMSINAGFIHNWNVFVDEMNSEDIYKGDLPRTLKQMIKMCFQGNIPGIDPNGINTMQKLGIEIDDQGHLKVDKDKWTKNIINNYDQVKSVMGFNAISNNPSFQLINRPKFLNNDLAGNPMDINLAKDAQGRLSATITLNGQSYPCTLGAVTGNNVVISGGANTPIADLNFVYTTLDQLADSSVDTNTLTMTQGFFDKLSGKLATSYFDAKNSPMDPGKKISGQFEAEVDRLRSKISREEDNVKKKEKQKDVNVQKTIKTIQRLQKSYLEMQKSLNAIKTQEAADQARYN